MLLETFESRKLRYILTLFSLICLLVLPHDAYAADQGYGSFWYGPEEKTVSGVTYLKTGVVASNKYDAALYALGFSKSTVTGISNAKKNKLISNSTFTSFASGFKTGKPDDDAFAVIPGIPTVGLYPDSMLTTWYAASAVYGDDSCYWSVYSEDAADSAESAAYRIIKSGDNVGGGGDTTTTPEINTDGWYQITLDASYEPYGGYDSPSSTYTVYDNPTVSLGSDGKGTVTGGSTGQSISWNNCKEIVAYIDPVTFQKLNGLDYNYVKYIRSAESTYLLASEYKYKFYKLTSSGYGIKNTSGKVNNYSSINSGNNNLYRINNKVCVFYYGTTTNYTRTLEVGASNNTPYKPYWTNDENLEPPSTDPPTEWPDPTPTPTPPDPPDPITPEPPNPWIPIPDEDIDITGEDFQDLIDALNEHCIHLQNSISSNISQLWSLQSDLFSDHMNAFWDNLHNDLLWLGECLNFDVNVNVDAGSGGGSEGGSEGETDTYVPFDDSSIIYWLKQIWSKLGDGISIKPVDPVVNPNGWWDWFSGLLAGLIGSLADIGLDKIGGLVDALDTLREKFPFCIPWDIAALLGLLVSEPVTPVIELPLMALSVSNGVQEVGSMRIDLSTYNDAWEAVRWIERIAFCVYLATRTKDFLDLLGKIKG